MKKSKDASLVRNGVKNYFVNLKYFFTPLGALFLGIVLGLSIVIPTLSRIFGDFCNEIGAVATGVQLDLAEVWNRLMSELGNLLITEPSEMLRILFKTNWISDTLHSIMQDLMFDYETFIEGVTGAVATAVNGIATCVKIMILFAFLGLVGGYFLTKYLVRRNIARRAWWKFILESLAEATVVALLIALCSYIMTLWTPSIFITVIVTILLFGLISLITAYVVQGKKFVPAKDVINLRNILRLLLSDLLIIIIAIVLTLAVILLTNKIVGIVVALPLLEIAYLVISMNAESYVKNIVDSVKPKE